jgi:hypothetical protein
MRQQAPIIPRLVRYLVLVLAMGFATGTVSADSRTDARVHYQAGVKFYSGGDYRSAIREFSAAQQLAPADLNNYNLALCYDKLGDAEPAIQYYRAYLDKQTSTDKRAEIEASIARLESAAKSVASKRAEEARLAEEARRAEETRRADEMRKADEARRAEETRRADDARRADEARKADEARRAEEMRGGAGGPGVGPVGPGAGPVGPGAGGPGPAVSGSMVGGGSTGTPGSGLPVSTGDAQLDRVQQIDVGSVRDQRMGAAGGGTMDPRVGPSGGRNPRVAQAGGPPPPSGGPAPATPDVQPKAQPVYKKWWFWAVVGVSAYVVYAIASEDSDKTNTRGREVLPLGPTPQHAGGMTLLRW